MIREALMSWAVSAEPQHPADDNKRVVFYIHIRYNYIYHNIFIIKTSLYTLNALSIEVLRFGLTELVSSFYY